MLSTFNDIDKKKKKILITGVTGQDGSNLVEYLLTLNEDIIIYGTLRSDKKLNHTHIKKFISNPIFIPIFLDLYNHSNTRKIFSSIKPDYFFNCAAQSVVNQNKNMDSINTMMINTMAPLLHLELIREYNNKCRYFSCGSCEEFGDIKYTPQDLNHPYNPINIYGISKHTTHNLIKYYRDNYNIFCCHAILYNHEGIKRGKNFVTRKITSEVAKIKLSIDNNIPPKPLLVGNIYSKRDWSDSSDFVTAFWKILNQDKANDYILSSGEAHSVKEFIDYAFEVVGINIKWNIDNENPFNNKAYYQDLLLVKCDQKYYRKNDVSINRNFEGNNMLTRKQLDWTPRITFKNLIKKMVMNDVELLKPKLKKLLNLNQNYLI